MATPNRRTFSLQTPADLYRKLNFEALELHNNPPNDLEHRAYAVMNAVTTAWQMKDWVYEALREAGALNHLNEFAGRIIRGKKDFGTFLCENSPWMNVCFQLATAAKHFDVGQDTGLEVLTTIEFQVAPETTVHELRGQDEIMVRTPRNSISGPDLVLLLDYIWSRALPRLGLLDSHVAE
ncbi:hypothetical protein [Paraburkholderia gardini]|uniref:hypothetical protein n=1 Tax=Paraburkholderia gardini TaxID=2823469 RepID=UPI001D1D4BF3|nr:hypothetical protein [Paraburkholderia gardini]CAG4890887.1 hypothetical protein R69919_01061 [Paraburkholderia gardini]